jgi:hypothetical protein
MLSLGRSVNFHWAQALGYLHSRVVETEGRFGLGDGDLPGDLGNVLVELSSDVVVVAEDERLLQLETDGNDILGVLFRESVGLIDFELVLEEEFLVIWSSLVRDRARRCPGRTRQLDDKRNVEDVL